MAQRSRPIRIRRRLFRGERAVRPERCRAGRLPPREGIRLAGTTGTAQSADVVVIGPHRARAFGDRVLGTTADQLVSDCAIPCLVVRGPLTRPVRRMIVPSDLSEMAHGALLVALEWGKALRGSAPLAEEVGMTVLHVDSGRAPHLLESVPGLRAWSTLKEQVAAAVEQSGPRPWIRIDQDVIHGSNPAEEILRFAGDAQADLLVMRTWGDRPLVKALMGSVSAAVARASVIPLLLVPPQVWAVERAPATAGSGAASVKAPSLS